MFLRRYIRDDNEAPIDVVAKFTMGFKSEEVVDESLAQVLELFTTIISYDVAVWCNRSAGIARDIFAACHRQVCCGSASHTSTVLRAVFQALRLGYPILIRQLMTNVVS